MIKARGQHQEQKITVLKSLVLTNGLQLSFDVIIAGSEKELNDLIKLRSDHWHPFEETYVRQTVEAKTFVKILYRIII